jgi:acyl-CoA thioesterase-2
VSAHTFAELVSLERRDSDIFVPTIRPAFDAGFVFGGQLMAQATWAAMATTEADRRPHSMHAHFLAAASPDRPLSYRVHRVRDGRSFSLRQVDADQDGRRVFTATVSFQRPTPGVDAADYQVPAPSTPHPRDGGPWVPVLGTADYFSVLDLRECPAAPLDADGHREYSRRVWFRLPQPVGDDPALHASALAFASDLGVTLAASVTSGLYGRTTVLTSLDHALWWHRPVRADCWTLLDLVSVSNSDERGTVRGTLHAADGTLAASLGQETLIR